MEKDKELEGFLSFYKRIVDNASINIYGNNQHNNFYTYITIARSDIEDDENNEYIIISTITAKNNIPNSNSVNPVPIKRELVLQAINLIRDDFRYNHEIEYIRFSPDYKLQIFKNKNLELKICIYSNEELENAKEYNYEINRDPNRTSLMRTKRK